MEGERREKAFPHQLVSSQVPTFQGWAGWNQEPNSQLHVSKKSRLNIGLGPRCYTVYGAYHCLRGASDIVSFLEYIDQELLEGQQTCQNSTGAPVWDADLIGSSLTRSAATLAFPLYFKDLN